MRAPEALEVPARVGLAANKTLRVRNSWPDGRVYAGDLDGVLEPVHLPDGFDHGALENPEVQRRRLEVARRHAPQGTYVGKKGAQDFREKDDEWAEIGLDYPRSLERSNEIKRAKAIAKNEVGGVARPLEQATVARPEARTLENDIAELDKRIKAEDTERAECKRRGVWRIGLAANPGELLAQRREKMIALDNLRQSRAFRLESIPAFATALEQIRSGGVKIKLLAAEIAGAAPASPFDAEAVEAEHAAIDRRAQKYLLDHDLAQASYLEAVAAVEAGRDRAEPVVPSRRLAPTRSEGPKLLDSETADVVQRARDYCEQQGWSAGNGELFGKALDAVSPALRMPE